MMLGSENWDLVEAIDNAEEVLKQYRGKLFVSSFLIKESKNKYCIIDVQHSHNYIDSIRDEDKSVISSRLRSIAHEVHQHNKNCEVDERITGNESPISDIEYYPLEITKCMNIMKVVYKVKSNTTTTITEECDDNPSN